MKLAASDSRIEKERTDESIEEVDELACDKDMGDLGWMGGMQKDDDAPGPSSTNSAIENREQTLGFSQSMRLNNARYVFLGR